MHQLRDYSKDKHKRVGYFDELTNMAILAINIKYEGYNKTHIMRSNMDKSASINFYIEEE